MTLKDLLFIWKKKYGALHDDALEEIIKYTIEHELLWSL